jgi:CRISPR-associated endonuclease/helicase Cas3
MTFDEFFKQATGHRQGPFDYQRRLAGGDSGITCQPQLINIPTGLGKTAAVVLAWLWNRVELEKADWPRRLVYCLPMRTLVEQTQSNVHGWLQKLDNREWDKINSHENKVGLHILMGGEDREKNPWDIYPEENAILIGTQDMLLSRALNRGYGMNRYRWPMHFGLLNNDCLWVMDETQLMGVGVETSAQFDGFRHMGTMPTFGVCPTWWMSATLDDTRLTTVDHPKPADGWPIEKLSDAEQSSGRPYNLITAAKKLSPAPLALNSETKDYAGQLAKLVNERHKTGTLTLVVVNRVKRAQEIFKALTLLYDREKVALIHSRFRRVDRERHTQLLFGDKDGKGDRIVIATQAVEAGVDVSARLLITELAPWSSLVQRMGRCNRRADIPDAEVLWVDIEPDAKGELLLPYTKDDLEKARAAIGKLSDASPRSLGNVDPKEVAEALIIRPVIRRRDLVDLFDTTPDICGQDLDVSRYIRDGEDKDVQFFWRKIPEEPEPDSDDEPPFRGELCRVSIVEAQKFIDKQPKPKRVWQWNALDELWQRIERVRPGGVYRIDAESGGYDTELGWTGDAKSKVTPLPSKDVKTDGQGRDPQTYDRDWLGLDKHIADVVTATTKLASSLSLDPVLSGVLRSAALWHDLGKAHKAFQDALRYGPYKPGDAGLFYAKSKNPYHPEAMDKNRRGFRHELASALAWLLKGPADAVERDLVAYLIAAHHGKVRLSIRSLPEEKGDPQDAERLFARGVWDGDKLPAVSLGEFTTPEIALVLSFMKMGVGEHGPSWLARTVALRDRLGPFRLAFLETLLRAADARASGMEIEV